MYKFVGPNTLKIGTTTFEFQTQSSAQKFAERIDTRKVLVKVDKAFHKDASDGVLKKENKAKAKKVMADLKPSKED